MTTGGRLLPGIGEAIRTGRLGIPGRWKVFSIAMYTGPSPLELAPTAGVSNPVLTRESVTDHHSSFVADPFMIQVDGTWNMFFESLNWVRARKGEIGLATSRDGIRWSYQGIVLAEPFHLSYPCGFEWCSDHFMIPESSAAGEVRLYRGDPFPRRWTHVATLLSGPVHFDSSVFRHDGRWWMFSETDSVRGTLRLYQAASLTGPWVEHPKSPIVENDLRIARPAGRVVSWSGRLIRFAQDCRGTYGRSVHALEIARLNPLEYEEVELGDTPVLAGSGRGWNRLGMHHIDAHPLADGSWIGCVDGWRYRMRRPGEMAIWARAHLNRVGRGRPSFRGQGP
jgi:hypothetical protein